MRFVSYSQTHVHSHTRHPLLEHHAYDTVFRNRAKNIPTPPSWRYEECITLLCCGVVRFCTRFSDFLFFEQLGTISLSKEFRSLLSRDYHWKRNLVYEQVTREETENMSGEIRSRKGKKGKHAKRKASQSLQDFEDELLSASPSQPSADSDDLGDEDEEGRFYSAAHRDSSVSFDEHEEPSTTSCLYKTIFFVLLLILGGIATIVLVDEASVNADIQEVREEALHAAAQEQVHVEEAHEEHGDEDQDRGGLVDVGEFVERVVNSFRLSEIFSEQSDDHDDEHAAEEEEGDHDEHEEEDHAEGDDQEDDAQEDEDDGQDDDGQDDADDDQAPDDEQDSQENAEAPAEEENNVADDDSTPSAEDEQEPETLPPPTAADPIPEPVAVPPPAVQVPVAPVTPEEETSPLMDADDSESAENYPEDDTSPLVDEDPLVEDPVLEDEPEPSPPFEEEEFIEEQRYYSVPVYDRQWEDAADQHARYYQ